MLFNALIARSRKPGFAFNTFILNEIARLSECAFRIHDMLISLYGKHRTIYIPWDMNLSESVAAAKFCRFRIANIASLSLN